MTYTPGPWKACYSDKVGGGNIRSDHRDGTGALLLEAGPMFHDYTPDREEELANLRLAAASPVLLAALKDVVSQIAAYDKLFGENSCAIDDSPAKQAIDKATKEVTA
jgi:hypothetical protein